MKENFRHLKLAPNLLKALRDFLMNHQTKKLLKEKEDDDENESHISTIHDFRAEKKKNEIDLQRKIFREKAEISGSIIE